MTAIIANARAAISWTPNPGLSDDGRYTLHRNDGAGGAVDYATVINTRRLPAYLSAPTERRLYGRGLYPRGGASAHRGWGQGGAGRGNGPRGRSPRGFDLDLRTATTPELADATYDMAVVAVDAAGNPTAAGATAAVTLAGSPEPPTELAADSYSSPAGQLTLTWTASTDDT